MFKNLEAEQHRAGYTNSQMAEILCMSRLTYEKKKKNGMFNRPQIAKLCELFKCSFEYLFATEAETQRDSA